MRSDFERLIYAPNKFISGVFCVQSSFQEGIPTINFKKYNVFYLIIFVTFRIGGGYPSRDELWTQKTPEINELEPRVNILKIWAHNFEKQKSCIFWKM